jgi:hypothetical protein
MTPLLLYIDEKGATEGREHPSILRMIEQVQIASVFA